MTDKRMTSLTAFTGTFWKRERLLKRGGGNLWLKENRQQSCPAASGSTRLRRCSFSFITDEKKPVFSDRFLKYGRRERIRTSDPLVPNQLRYQAALLADGGACYCDPRSASTAFCAFAADRLESTRLLIYPRPFRPFTVVITAVSPGWSLGPGTSYWPD